MPGPGELLGPDRRPGRLGAEAPVIGDAEIACSVNGVHFQHQISCVGIFSQIAEQVSALVPLGVAEII